jgi:hypothetical protein
MNKVTHSVFDYRRGRYDYFEAPLGDFPASGFFRPSSNANTNIAEAYAARLPANARKVGDGVQARGIVSTTLSGIPDASGGVTLSKNVTIGLFFAALTVAIFVRKYAD